MAVPPKEDSLLDKTQVTEEQTPMLKKQSKIDQPYEKLDALMWIAGLIAESWFGFLFWALMIRVRLIETADGPRIFFFFSLSW